MPHTDIVWSAKTLTIGLLIGSIYSISVFISVLSAPPESDLNEGRLVFNVLQGSRT